MSRFTSDELALAKSADLCAVAERLGYTVVRVGHYHSLKEMDSIRIYNRRSWCRFSKRGSEGQGGSQIDFLKTFANMDIKDAVFWLLDFIGYQKLDSMEKVTVKVPQKKEGFCEREAKPFFLPPHSSNDMRIRNYLTKDRGLSEKTVDMFIKQGLIYESSPHHNAVFIGTDPKGVPRFASMRGTYDKNGKAFKCDVEGNDKRYGFHLEQKYSEQIVVFEAAIDLMSYIDIYHDMNSHLLALGMVADNPLEQYLKDHPEIRYIRLCLDNDERGREATKRLMGKYIGRGYQMQVLFPMEPYKDMNEWLKSFRKREKTVGSWNDRATPDATTQEEKAERYCVR
jgi:hypothetical protein